MLLHSIPVEFLLVNGVQRNHSVYVPRNLLPSCGVHRESLPIQNLCWLLSVRSPPAWLRQDLHYRPVRLPPASGDGSANGHSLHSILPYIDLPRAIPARVRSTRFYPCGCRGSHRRNKRLYRIRDVAARQWWILGHRRNSRRCLRDPYPYTDTSLRQL